MQCAHESNSLEGNSEFLNLFSIPFYHLSIIKGFIRTESRGEKPRGCLMWTSRMWWFLTQEGGLASQNLMVKEREEMDSIKLKWFTLYSEGEFPDCEACWAWPLVPCLSFSSQLKRQCLGEASLGDSRGLGEERLPFKPSVQHVSLLLQHLLCRVVALLSVCLLPWTIVCVGAMTFLTFFSALVSVPSTVPMGALDKTLLNE